MTTDTDSVGNSRERTVIYSVVAITFAILLIVALIAYSAAASNSRAEAKADQLIAALEQAGVAHPPAQERIVRVLGEDGGAICADPNSALTRATLLSQLANGAGGPGTRPVIVDERVVEGQRLILQIYCPEHLADFQQFADDLHTSDVAK
ncbi:hypothetical protein [Nocardia salmonicida]|uniref:hypothetical protein n=1 Tax=Nocardia salmonicida TaxID=53431 RepID=UPI0034056012